MFWFFNVNRVKVLQIFKDFFFFNIFSFFQLEFFLNETADLQEHCFSKLLTISKYLQPFCPSPINLWTIWLIPAKLERGVEVMEITSRFIKTRHSRRLDTREPGRSRGSKRTSMAMTAADSLAQWWALETSVYLGCIPSPLHFPSWFPSWCMLK